MAIDYRPATDQLSIVAMVYNRVPFLGQTINNDLLLRSFIWEVMVELEGCFNVAILPDGTVDDSRVGQEGYYSVIMRSIIADLVAVYVMLIMSAQTSQDSSTGGNSVRYLKKAKAGTAEVEWGELDIKKSGSLNIGGPALISKYEQMAARKARQLGCIIDICTDCVGLTQSTGALPFLTLTSCGCSH